MPTFPDFNSGYLQEEIDWANHCREQEEAELKLKLNPPSSRPEDFPDAP